MRSDYEKVKLRKMGTVGVGFGLLFYSDVERPLLAISKLEVCSFAMQTCTNVHKWIVQHNDSLSSNIGFI